MLYTHYTICCNNCRAIPEIRVVKRESGSEHAEYLVVACLGTTLLAAWKRYSELMAWAAEAKRHKFERTVAAWEEVKGGKRMFRCLGE
jgi:hypothetical protein